MAPGPGSSKDDVKVRQLIVYDDRYVWRNVSSWRNNVTAYSNDISELTDCTIICRDASFPVHRVTLQKKSPFFETAFTRGFMVSVWTWQEGPA